MVAPVARFALLALACARRLGKLEPSAVGASVALNPRLFHDRAALVAAIPFAGKWGVRQVSPRNHPFLPSQRTRR